MQIDRFMVLLAAVMLPFLAHAKGDFRKPDIGPDPLAAMQAEVDYCVAVDARNASYFRQQEELALDPYAESGILRDRETPAYHEQYHAFLAGYERLPAGFGAATCAFVVATSRGREQ